MTTHRAPVAGRGCAFFRDYDGTLTKTKYEDDVESFSWDLTNVVPSGETVSSVAYDAQSGLSVSGAALVTPVWSCTVTKTGVLEVTATFSGGSTLTERFAWQPIDEGVSDY
jgi:hypothetical protein